MQQDPATALDPTEDGVLPEPSLLPFPVIGIGASAGGLVALLRLLEQMPADSGMAFVVVLHLSPKHESNADKVLQRATRMPVVQVQGRMAIEQNHVYVISPAQDLLMDDGHLSSEPSKRVRGRHTAIDSFLRTLAGAHRERAIGIILSGTGTDGALGIGAIKEGGGVTIAQLPEDAEYDEMPRAAQSTGHVDIVLPAVEIPEKLVELWRNAPEIQLPAQPPELPSAAKPSDHFERDTAAVEAIIRLLALRSGHDFHHYKRATVLRRIERRLQVNALRDVHQYQEYLAQHDEEVPLLLADMLISVTSFFRDRPAFDALERQVVPALMRDRLPGEQVRAWVVGCATGEEAYSIAMMLVEEAEAKDDPPSVQVFATDIDNRAIARARIGLYPESIVSDVPPSRLRRFFDKEGHYYRVKKSIRDKVLFAHHNVLRDPPFSRLDVISCRNVLIYLNRDIQARLFHMLHFSLSSGGTLFLGNSESADAAVDLFDAADKRHRIYRARPRNANDRRTPQLPLRIEESERIAHVPEAAPAGGLSHPAIHQRALEVHAPPSVMVDANGDIVHSTPGASRFLRFSSGEPSRNLATVVDPSLRVELRTALFQAMHTVRSVEARRVRMEHDGRTTFVNMVARPFHDDASGRNFALVVFDEVEDSMGEPWEQRSPGSDSVVSQLEEELQDAKRRLQMTVEQSEVSTEELKASNEELQAINEELRSTTEELETSKEELQSVNEELTTVNFELRHKVDETEKLNDDLQNLIASTEIASVFVDSDLHIKRFTPPAVAIFNLLPGDIGRSLLDITHRLDYPELGNDAGKAFRKLQVREREVRSLAGRTYMVRVLPYRTAEHRIDGAVLTFVDVTTLRAAEGRSGAPETAAAGRLRESLAEGAKATQLRDEFLSVMSHELRHPLNLIRVNAELLARMPELAGVEKPLRAVGAIRRSVAAQARIVDDLLDLSRVRNGKLQLDLQPMDLSAVAERAVQVLQLDAASADLTVTFAGSAEPVMVIADAMRIDQIVSSLVGNAVKFTPQGGTILVTVAAHGRRARLLVTDSGTGIAPEFLPHVFEMFGQASQRAASHQTGLGIGLALVRQLVEHQSGVIEAQSAGPDRGAQFLVTLPLYDGFDWHADGADVVHAGSSRLAGVSLLLVDDSPDTLDVTASVLELEGASVLSASSGAQALEQLGKDRVDVVLSDLGMPGMDGLALIAEIRKTRPIGSLPAIALSGYASAKDIDRSLAAGFSAHVGKPLAFEPLVDIVLKLLGRAG